MSMSAFDRLAQWKQNELKKQVRLFWEKSTDPFTEPSLSPWLSGRRTEQNKKAEERCSWLVVAAVCLDFLSNVWSLPSGQNWGKIPTKKGKLSGRKLKEEQRASLELQRVACASPTSRWQCVYTSVTVFVWTTDVLFKKLQVCQKTCILMKYVSCSRI